MACKLISTHTTGKTEPTTARLQGTYLGQCHVGNDDLVQGAGSILEVLRCVTVWVIFVFVEFFASTLFLIVVPWHRILADADVGLGRRARRGATEVPASNCKGTSRNSEKDLKEEQESRTKN